MRKAVNVRKRIAGVAIAAALVATAFNPGSCTITVDENLVNQVSSWLDNLDTSGMSMPGHDSSMGRWHGGPQDQHE
jgi:hypothetical protein